MSKLTRYRVIHLRTVIGPSAYLRVHHRCETPFRLQQIIFPESIAKHIIVREIKIENSIQNVMDIQGHAGALIMLSLENTSKTRLDFITKLCGVERIACNAE